jgi:ActR/RegA family two-component response regulator
MMSGETDLNGRAVLVVDDDFYLAEDTREALEEAGAVVLGPYGREDDALGSIKDHRPEFAVLDLNLGSGPSFKLARAMKAIGTPMIVVTGYDDDILPPDLADTPRLRKPVNSSRLVEAVAELIG